jgi:hypothetical protein
MSGAFTILRFSDGFGWGITFERPSLGGLTDFYVE